MLGCGGDGCGGAGLVVLLLGVAVGGEALAASAGEAASAEAFALALLGTGRVSGILSPRDAAPCAVHLGALATCLVAAHRVRAYVRPAATAATSR